MRQELSNERMVGHRVCLIVDDSARVRVDARAILEPMGFIVVVAEDGEEGLLMCRQSMPDVVLLDWLMPGMDGLDFLKAMRLLPGGTRTRVIFCSGHDRPADIHRAIQAGAAEYLLKPFDRDLLAFKLRQAGLMAA